MCLYDTRKALFYTRDNKFKDIIDNIIKSVDDLYSTFHRSLEKLEKDYEDVSKSSTYYEDGFYDEYEKESELIEFVGESTLTGGYFLTNKLKNELNKK